MTQSAHGILLSGRGVTNSGSGELSNSGVSIVMLMAGSSINAAAKSTGIWCSCYMVANCACLTNSTSTWHNALGQEETRYA